MEGQKKTFRRPKGSTQLMEDVERGMQKTTTTQATSSKPPQSQHRERTADRSSWGHGPANRTSQSQSYAEALRNGKTEHPPMASASGRESGPHMPSLPQSQNNKSTCLPPPSTSCDPRPNVLLHMPTEAMVESTPINAIHEVAESQSKHEHVEDLKLQDKSNTDLINVSRQLRWPWRESYRIGYGVDISTGDSTATCALTSFNTVSTKQRPKDVEFSQSIFIVEIGEQFQDGIGLQLVFGTTEITAGNLPMEVKIKIQSMISSTISGRMCFIHFKATAEYEPEYVSKDIGLEKSVQDLTYQEFREQYGDFYIAGFKLSASCEGFLLCQMSEEINTDHLLQMEASAHLSSLLMGEFGYAESKTHTEKSTRLHQLIRTKGCSKLAFASSPGKSDDPKAALETLLQNAVGEKEFAYLYHYSTLDPTIPRLIERVYTRLFDKLEKIKEHCKVLQDFLTHPASNRTKVEHAEIKNALNLYRSDQQKLAHPSTIKEWYIASSEMEAHLLKLKDRKLDLEIRYHLMLSMKNMRSDVKFLRPTGASRTSRWECGKSERDLLVGGENKLESGSREVTFGSGQKVLYARWTATNVAPRRGPKQFVEFRTRRKEEHSSKTTPVGNQEKLVFEWVGNPVYVLGWTLSVDRICRESDIKVSEENNCILSDYLSIHIDKSKVAQWTCQVFFVPQDTHTFLEFQVPRCGE
ncbi:hypothetical protein VNI00_016237 [Paramarasmius palmivorus]|uniref:Uncharacterized protein n=1 Tax=Paramarasmius palmivorus TaxID=297713 RepID=A0AAW0AZH7_9AGAR